MLFRADRTHDSSKRKGGGLCVYINNDWSTNNTALERYCSPDLEYLMLKCRPFYLSVVVIVAVYIPSRANAKPSLAQLHMAISKRQDAYPNGAFIIAGDFNTILSACTVSHQRI